MAQCRARVRHPASQAASPIDENFLRVLSEGLPPCAGIAPGFDRLIILLDEAIEIPQESETAELKAFSGGVSVKELSQTFCAFANSRGGAVYLGVTDSGQICGIPPTGGGNVMA